VANLVTGPVQNINKYWRMPWGVLAPVYAHAGTQPKPGFMHLFGIRLTTDLKRMGRGKWLKMKITEKN
jgi:hypothetical protein